MYIIYILALHIINVKGVKIFLCEKYVNKNTTEYFLSIIPMNFHPDTDLSYYPLTNFLFCDIIRNVYASEHKFMEDIMDDGDGETCHSMNTILIRQA